MPLKLNPTTCKLDMVMGPGKGTAVIEINVDDSTAPGTNPVVPTVGGQITISGAAVAAHNIPIETHSRAANEFNIEVQVGSAVTGAPGNTNAAGVVQFDDTQFTVNADGYVSLVGGGIGVDSVTGDDAVAVPGDGAGNINFIGTIVANATNAKPLYFDGDAPTFTQALELQVATERTGAPANTNDAGIASFDDTAFVVDVNGYVTLVGGGVPSVTNTGDDSVAVSPDGVGNFNWIGLTVANAAHAKPVFFKDSVTPNAIDLDVQVAADITGAPVDSNDAGLSSFNDTQFVVDANGYVSLVGGTDLPSLQTITSDDPTAVGPNASGNIDLTGEAVANATNAKPIFVDAGVNALNVEVQVAADITGAPADKNDAGICSFDDTMFTVDANGFVQLAGGGLAIDTFTTDIAGPVSPDGTGEVDVTGTSVFSDGTALNTLTLNVQATANTFLLGAGVGSTATELGPLTDGQLIIGATAGAPAAANIISTDGSISITNGANSIDIEVAAGDDAVLTLTADSGGALNPFAGNIDVLGLSGSKTSGATNVITVKSPPYADAGASATSTLNTGEFVTGAFTRTLPASAGLADGDLIEYICTSASALVIQAVGSQKIRLGSSITSAAGTCTSTAIGDSISLRFRATDGFWYATSMIGNWALA
jgi:hypothetical protein